MRLITLHGSAGSGNPLGVSSNYDRLPFAPYFVFKDLVTIFLFIIIFLYLHFSCLIYWGILYVMANSEKLPELVGCQLTKSDSFIPSAATTHQ